MIDFLGMQKNAPRLYHYSLNLEKIVIVFSAISVTYNSLTGNYYITNKINLLFAPIHLIYIIYILIHLRKKLNAAQHYLVYGILLFGFAVAFLTVNSFLFKEQSLISASIVAKSTILCISLLFLVGLHKQLQQHDQERIVVLEQLNDMHLQYNTTIEKKVRERTLKLKNTNAKLVEQQVQLIEKNRHIEILIDELNHRVKNNLQMLYSLNTLQLPLIEDYKSKQILNEMRGRIKAMMLVNEHLHAYKSNQSVTFSAFINEIANHLQQIYDRKRNIKIIMVIPADLQLRAIEALPFGLLLTELFTNAYKHAFAPSQTDSQIRLSLFSLENKLRFVFEDNGQGTEDIIQDTSMGISLIQDLTRQLKGTVTIQPKNGLSYLFIFSNTRYYAHINY
jgi:two-component sensor histidine kinase